MTSLAASLLLSGCKPANNNVETTASVPAPTQPAPAPQPPSPSAQDFAQDIICFGDSLTAGFGTDLGQSYPDHLQRLLDAQGFHYHVVNAGISGNTTKDGLERLPLVLARHPQIVVVEFGGNDGLRGLPIEQTQANLSSILSQLQASGAQVVLAGITLPPSYGPDYINKFNAMYPALAKQHRIPFLPFLLKDVYGVPGDMQEDATHATAQGNQQVALNVEALLKPLLKK
ncbi:MAG TPA: arylesterase [Acidobacteriaceae bacterium]|nr:arylesterase [Acidobacteriaceae bacterium]